MYGLLKGFIIYLAFIYLKATIACNDWFYLAINQSKKNSFMKRVITCIAVMVLAACNKTGVKPGANIVSTASEDLSIVKTRSLYLVSHPWKYNGFYFEYVDQQHKGDPQYIRGASNNLVDLDATTFFFRKNGSFVELDGGDRLPGTWSFSDASASLLILEYNYGKSKDSILVLNQNHWNYTKPIYDNKKSYSELVPAQ